ncbi:GNAT family N-acetyltransferase [Pyxidicoccus sp. 3LG]
MTARTSDPSTRELLLRDVEQGDLPYFFENQLDSEANRMAALTAKDPSDRDAFMARWARILGDSTTTTRTIVLGGQVAGHVSTWVNAGHLEVTYWVAKRYWGQGGATRALSLSLEHVVKARPVQAHAVRDNVASLRVLEKCGFIRCGEARDFANGRGEEVEEVILVLRA